MPYTTYLLIACLPQPGVRTLPSHGEDFVPLPRILSSHSYASGQASTTPPKCPLVGFYSIFLSLYTVWLYEKRRVDVFCFFCSQGTHCWGRGWVSELYSKPDRVLPSVCKLLPSPVPGCRYFSHTPGTVLLHVVLTYFHGLRNLLFLFSLFFFLSM